MGPDELFFEKKKFSRPLLALKPCPPSPPSAPPRASRLPARPPPRAARRRALPPLPWLRHRRCEEKEEKREKRRERNSNRWTKKSDPLHRSSLRSPRLVPLPPAMRSATPRDDSSPSRLHLENHTRTGTDIHKHYKKKHHQSSSTLSSSKSQPTRMRLLPARAEAASTTSLYERLGSDAIKLVTSNLFDK